MITIIEIINIILLLTIAILIYKNNDQKYDKIILPLLIIDIIVFICGILIP